MEDAARALVTVERPAEGALVFNIDHRNLARLRESTEQVVERLQVVRCVGRLELEPHSTLDLYEDRGHDAVLTATVVARRGWWRRQWQKVREEKAAEVFVLLLGALFLVAYGLLDRMSTRARVPAG